MTDEVILPPKAGAPIAASTREDVVEAIRNIQNLDLRIASIDEIKALLPPLWKGRVFECPIIPLGLQLYRLRPFPDEKPSNVSEVGIPPNTAVTKDQRCNRAGQPLFYCSTARNVPFFELHVEVGHRLVLSTWKTTKKLLVNKIGYTQTAFSALSSNRDCPPGNPTGRNVLNASAVVASEAEKIVDEFLASQFTMDVRPGDEHLYKLTIALSEKQIHGGNFSLGGLLYPTIPMWGNADNLALTPAFVSNGLEFVRAEYLQITRIDGKLVTFTTFDTTKGKEKDGSLLWKGHGDRWTLKNQGDELSLSCEDGLWIARDKAGRIVEPD